MERIIEVTFPSDGLLNECLPLDLKHFGLRTSGPRHRQFIQSCKSRWKGNSLRKCFAAEYSSRPKQYYDAMIEAGLLRIVKFSSDAQEVPDSKRRRLDPDRNLTGDEQIIHESILTEAVVPRLPVRLVHIAEDESYIIVEKPPGIPCYPQGPFEYCSVQKLLECDESFVKSLKKFHTYFVSRLDRVTGGLVIIAMNAQKCSELGQRMSEWKKGYLAEVRGDFSQASAQKIPHVKHLTFDDTLDAQGILCLAPLEKLQHVPGTVLKVQVNDLEGKPSSSLFYPLQTRKDRSLVLCFPITGRTHQLRAHLQHLGFPILGDNLYDEASLKDIKDHDKYIVIAYTKDESRRILQALPISKYLGPLDLKALNELHNCSVNPSDTIKAVYVANGSEIQRRQEVFPDLAYDDQEGIIYSFHPFVCPWQIPLHACVYLRESDDCVTIKEIPHFAHAYNISVSDIIAKTKSIWSQTDVIQILNLAKN